MSSSLIQLDCGCNNYPWGKKGKESLAAQYAASTPGGSFKLDESKNYAEVCFNMLYFFCSLTIAFFSFLHITRLRQIMSTWVLKTFGFDHVLYFNNSYMDSSKQPISIHASPLLNY